MKKVSFAFLGLLLILHHSSIFGENEKSARAGWFPFQTK
jgi:hypothetical protein